MRSRATASQAGTKPQPYHWTCGAGHTGTGEAAAQRHAKECELMGYPKGYDERRDPRRSCAVTLTRKGLIAAICAAAEPYDWTRKAGDQ